MKIIQPDVCLTLRVTASRFSLFCFNERAVRSLQAAVSFEQPRSYLSSSAQICYGFWKLLLVISLLRLWFNLTSIQWSIYPTPSLSLPSLTISNIYKSVDPKNCVSGKHTSLRWLWISLTKYNTFFPQYSWVLEKILNWNCLTVLGSSVGMFLHIYGMLPGVYN